MWIVCLNNINNLIKNSKPISKKYIEDFKNRNLEILFSHPGAFEIKSKNVMVMNPKFGMRVLDDIKVYTNVIFSLGISKYFSLNKTDICSFNVSYISVDLMDHTRIAFKIKIKYFKVNFKHLKSREYNGYDIKLSETIFYLTYAD